MKDIIIPKKIKKIKPVKLSKPTQEELNKLECIDALNATMARVNSGETVSVAVVELDQESGIVHYCAGIWGNSYIAIIGGLTRLISRIGKDLDDE